MGNSNRVWKLLAKKLTGTLSAEEDIELLHLFEQDPEIWYSWELLNARLSLDDLPAEFLKELNLLLNEPSSTDEIIPELSEQNEIISSPGINRRRFLIPVLSVFLLIFSGLFYLFYETAESKLSSIDQFHEIVSPNGSKTKITLNDGTEIWLNAGSKIKYPKSFSIENREVYLVGEAYFKVVHHDKYSFVVHTQEVDIIDLGTTFNVKAYSGASTTETTLIEGSIEVVMRNKPGQKILIEPNQKLTIHNLSHIAETPSQNQRKAPALFEVSNIIPYQETNDIIETAWIEDKLIFRNQRFDDLLREMERRYDIKIDGGSEEVKNYQVTGILKNENIYEALELLQVIVPFNYKVEDEQIKISE